jgi:Rhomboid family
MSGADLTNLYFVLICLMAVLLVLFLYEVVRTPLELARATEQPVLNLPEPPPPAPAAPAAPSRAAAALPVRRPPQIPTFPVFSAGAAGQTGNGSYAARHASPYVPISRTRVAGGPPWDPAPRPSDGNGRASLPARHPGRLPSLWAARPASSPCLSAGRRANLASGRLLGNMLFLLIFGNNIEDRFRKLPYLIFYLASGYVAAYGFAAGLRSLDQALAAHARPYPPRSDQTARSAIGR